MAQSTRNTTRTIFTKAVGGYEALEIRKVALPKIGPSDIQVEVKAAGLNFYDIYIRQGLGEVKPPCALGLECAGIVAKVGAIVTSFKADDHVIVHCSEGGAFSDIVVTDHLNALLMPPAMTFEDAAAITINYLTAYFSLIESGGLRDSQTVVIQSAAGGVGWAATQIAKMYCGTTVIGIASKHKHDSIRTNGVDIALSYDQDIKKEVLFHCPQGASLVLENMAGDSFSKSQELLSPLGKVVLIGAKNMVVAENRSLFHILWTWWKTKYVSPYEIIVGNIGVAGFHLNNLKKSRPEMYRDTWEKIVAFYSQGTISPKIDSVFTFHQIEEACRRITNRENVGKIILKP